MATANDAVRIDGLREFQASLKAMDGNSQKMLRLALNKAAVVVADAARPMVPVRSGRAAATVKVASTQREGKVKGGSAGAPYYPWLDFGGSVGKHNSVKRPFLKKGRYLYPAYESNKPKVEEALADALQDLITHSGLEAS